VIRSSKKAPDPSGAFFCARLRQASGQVGGLGSAPGLIAAA